MVNTLADLQGEVEAETLVDTLRYSQPLVDTVADLSKQCSTHWLSREQRWGRDAMPHTERCVGNVPHAASLAQPLVNTLADSQAEVEQGR